MCGCSPTALCILLSDTICLSGLFTVSAVFGQSQYVVGEGVSTFSWSFCNVDESCVETASIRHGCVGIVDDLLVGVAILACDLGVLDVHSPKGTFFFCDPDIVALLF